MSTHPTENVAIPTLVLALPDGRHVSACSPEADGALRTRKGLSPAEASKLTREIEATAVAVPDQQTADAIILALGDLRKLAYPA